MPQADVRYVADFKSNINKLYAHFSASANRQAKLEAMYEVLGDPAVKLKSNTDIRWLSLNNAIQAIYRTYRSVVETLNEEAQETKNAKTLGLHSFMTTFMFCTLLCLLVDVLNILTKLCKTMQYRDLLYAYVKPKIALAVGEIKGMKNVSWPSLKAFERSCALMPPANPQRAIWRFAETENKNDNVDLKCNTSMTEKFSSLKNQYLQSLAENLESRLSARTGELELERLQMLDAVTSAVQQQLSQDDLRVYEYHDDEATDSEGTCNTRI